MALGNIKQSQEKQKLEHDKRTYIQKLAAALILGEALLLSRDCVTLQIAEQEVSEYFNLPKKKTLSERIQENMPIYFQDLNRGDLEEPFISIEISGEDWILETYYQMGTILAEKEWNKIARKKLNSYFMPEKRKSIWKISKRVYQLFVARGEGYLRFVEHFDIINDDYEGLKSQTGG
ncbi:hypothetical protein C2G38_2179871 [Gigaspora rosea]|uniref:Uncharacterized protein n=1 Tax=Gigaspora rosea TaxID=44941 RepID=A0A397VDY1_9GLOM|nr:hypothetical protein C2G38_2179871 [Gigaspora rosea]